MPESPFIANGAAVDPGNSAPLTMMRYITGLWTQRSLLRDAATPFLYEKFYSATRFDSLSDGLNTELTVRLTMGRAPGSTAYNTNDFPEIIDFYPFRTSVEGAEQIHVMADTAGAVYDATGPSTNLNIWNKSAGAGQTYFMSVGNTLYFGNGVDTKQWLQANLLWHADTSYNAGDWIIDPNHNIQAAVGQFTVAVTNIQISGNVLSVTLDPNDEELPFQLNLLQGVNLTFFGLTDAGFLNGQTVSLTGTTPNGNGANVFTAIFNHADYASTPDTGTVTSGTGDTGETQPNWNETWGQITIDGGQQWINKGNWIRNWGIIAPKKRPSATQTPLALTEPAWAALTYYSTSFLIYDPATNVIQKVTTFGSTGGAEPDFNTSPGATTPDGSVVWTSQGSGVYSGSATYPAGAYVFAQDATGTVYFFQAANGGLSGSSAPAWNAVLGSITQDNGIGWVNVGIGQTWGDVTATSFSGGFGYLPLQDGGTLAIGAGSGPFGGLIGLPAGYSNARMITWASPETGFSGTSVVAEGVFQSNAAGGTLTSQFQGNFGGAAFNASSNWVAAAWTSDATVTQGTLGPFTTLAVTTLNGDTVVFVTGTLASGESVPLPAGYAAEQFIGIAGMSASTNPGHIMQIVETCSLDGTLELTANYNDGDGNTWTGSANIFGMFYLTGGGITFGSVTNGIGVEIVTNGTNTLALLQGSNIETGSSLGLPAGYTGAVSSSAAAMSGGTSAGGNHGHGYSVSMEADLEVSAFYQDNGGHTWNGAANVFAIASQLDLTPISPNQTVSDGVGSLQQISKSGLSSATAPGWNERRGGITLDNGASWTNVGAYLPSSTDAWTWWYSYRSSIDGSESSLSPVSLAVQLDSGNYIFLQGLYSTDPQVDIVVIYRSTQGLSTPLEEDMIPNNVNGGTWSYADENSDLELNDLIVGAIAPQNAPPPSNFLPMAYHLLRIFGFCANKLTWSGGPDTTVGNGNTAFPAKNVFAFQSTGSWAWSTTVGLLAFTVADVQVVNGQGTAASPLYPRQFQEGVGLTSKNVFCVNGSTAYMMTTAKRVISFDPGAGELEVGFPVGDIFTNSFDPATSYATFHEGESEDLALYVADGSTGWYRMGTLSAPEQGVVWSPKRNIVGGVRCVKSVEVTPGQKLLLMGQKGGGKIMYRDYDSYSDLGAAYPMFVAVGNIIVAQPGSLASIDFVTLDSMHVGTAPTVSLLLNEIPGQPQSPAYTKLKRTGADLPLLRPSVTLFNDRFDYSQQQKPQDCRHLNMRIDWATEAIQNELLMHTIYGAIRKEK